MYGQGISTRKIQAATEERCGHGFSASSISAINKRLAATLVKFAALHLDEPSPDLMLDACDQKVREEGAIRSLAGRIAIGIPCEGQRQVAMDLRSAGQAGSESRLGRADW